MRKFIISDLHGNGNIYASVIKYLENINKDDEVILYINGDLIDRGTDSAYMLLDVRKRIINKKGFEIKYLGGNHELMMYQAAIRRTDMNTWPISSLWFQNGGGITANGIKELVDLEEEKKIIEFISERDIYYKFDEKLDDKQIVLVHAKCPNKVEDICNLKIKHNNAEVSKAVWTRIEDLSVILKESLGNKDYFTIIGHSQVMDGRGFLYYKAYDCLNIDGGCAAYAYGYLSFDHSPLVEIDEKNNRLIILTFNNNNEIIHGNYFMNKKIIKMDNIELEEKRKYIDKDVKIKKLQY